MDLSTQNTMNLTFDMDENTGLTTLTFKDVFDVSLGEVKIETVRLRSLFDSILNLSKEYSASDNLSIQGYRVRLDKNAKTAKLEFG